MRQLDVLPDDPIDVFTQCVDNISDLEKKKNFQNNGGYIAQAITDYHDASNNKTWCNLSRMQRGNDDAIVAGKLKKGDLVDLYSKNMTQKTAPARSIYNSILAAANGKCPYCGGIGHVRTLDHYLPKSYFPLYSVLPANLVPCCRDCNTESGSTFAATADKQTIHPYFDDQHFFDEKWIVGEVQEINPITIKFFAIPPTSWDDTDKKRVKSHFSTYGLAERYRVEASWGLEDVIDCRRQSLEWMSPESFRNFLEGWANNPSRPINELMRVMYDALAKSDWFCSKVF